MMAVGKFNFFVLVVGKFNFLCCSHFFPDFPHFFSITLFSGSFVCGEKNMCGT